MEELSKDFRNIDKGVLHMKSNRTSQKSLFFFHQSSQKLNMIIEDESSSRYNNEEGKIPNEPCDEIPEEEVTMSENLATTEISEFNTHNIIRPRPVRSIVEFLTNQNSTMFKSRFTSIK